MSDTSGSALDLLRSLGGNGAASRLRPGGGQDPLSTEELARTGSFSELLARARAGGISSGSPVTISAKAGIELSPQQLQRLSVAADMAQAAGATRVLTRIDGRTLTLDVGTRQVTGEVSTSPGQVVTGIDAVMDIPAAPGSPTLQAVSTAVNSAMVPRPAAGVSRSVFDALAASGA